MLSLEDVVAVVDGLLVVVLLNAVVWFAHFGVENRY